ncbi:D-Ala-D-Ala carboxypeptidase family metallohydrolase [Motiliproteus sp. MSK22-1]|uniref:D-Ala-D-Ala carboxypeptidase family metallohydrolase n=1 Tax=Motiliproteus sp. MSK22-1 TaxID=1897630 RepID=UPI000976CEB0|nr:D-Ala-D-Ala carboxypeptidase family metallohydrolase [Motiliproteus sp. MSK22-1]OMH25525.1 hypothetical protein BGP75_23470 [Motiliproteus sp. MSK22-1]
MRYFILIFGLLFNDLGYGESSHQSTPSSRQIVEIGGYPIPTKEAFRNWMLAKKVTAKVVEIHRYFLAGSVQGRLPLYLVLLQGTDWQSHQYPLFTLPDRKHWSNMRRTLQLLETEIIPVVGDLIPVSGERSQEYNRLAGGAEKSKHLIFCALDLVPSSPIEPEHLHQMLLKIYREKGQLYNMGLGLYSGTRFHIDTCGYRHW